MSFEISGFAPARFATVKDAFAANVAAGEELGQPHLPEAVETAAGDIRQVKRCRAGPAHARGFLDNALVHLHVLVEAFHIAKREARSDQAIPHLRAL